MKVSDLIESIRLALNDKETCEFSDAELLIHINSGIHFLETLLVNDNSSLLMKCIDIPASPAVLPRDFLKIYKITAQERTLSLKPNSRDVKKGEYSIIGDAIVLHDIPAEFFYFAAIKAPESMQETLNIPQCLLEIVRLYAVISALRRLEYDTQQENALLNEITAQALEVFKRRDGALPIRRYVKNSYRI